MDENMRWNDNNDGDPTTSKETLTFKKAPTEVLSIGRGGGTISERHSVMLFSILVSSSRKPLQNHICTLMALNLKFLLITLRKYISTYYIN